MPLKVGDEAPDFELRSHRGGTVRLSDFRGRHNVVVAFHPLAFTPVCASQMCAYESDRPKLDAAGTVVLHVCPEAAIGGPLGLVDNGDEIELDVPQRRLTLHVAADELERRQRGRSAAPCTTPERGYLKLFVKHVLQAHEGCDFDFLRGV